MAEFYNPYTFIPPMDPPVDAKYDATKPSENMLHQGKPAGHDRYHKGLWSGRIGIEIETVTPLLVPEARPEPPKAGVLSDHKVFKTRRTPDDKPLLPVSTLKGPLRAAYEAVTNSRFGVFEEHSEPLARRMTATEGLGLIPGRIVRNGTGFDVELWKGTTTDYPERVDVNGKLRWQVTGDVVYAAWLLSYYVGNTTPTRRVLYKGVAPAAGVPRHGDEVFCWVEQRARGAFNFWNVLEIAMDAKLLSTRMVASAGALAAPKQVRGWVVASNQNTENKHDERVFFVDMKTAPEKVPITPADQNRLRDRWRDLIANYRATNKIEIEGRKSSGNHTTYISGAHGMEDKPALSRHLYSIDDVEIKLGDPFSSTTTAKTSAGTLCFVRLKMNGNVPFTRKVNIAGAWVDQPEVEDIFPVMISRELGNWAPVEMLGSRLAPAKSLDELSPADRVFGWVRDGDGVGASAWKGQLRIAPIRCVGCKDKDGKDVAPIEKIPNGPLPLAILSTPKPSQARFYVAKDRGGAPLDAGDISRSGYFEGRNLALPDSRPQSGLRGRKVFLHHAATRNPAVAASYWNAQQATQDARNGQPPVPVEGSTALYREYVRHPKNAQLHRDGQNRSIVDWIRPGTRFSTHIDVVNLNAAELGALLWLLDLPHFLADEDVNDGADAEIFHRIGGAKPLGLGSVKITLSSHDLKDGAAIEDSYRTLIPIEEQQRKSAVEGLVLATGRAAATEAARLFVNSGFTRFESTEKKICVSFRRSLRSTYGNFEDIPFIAAFLAAARGHADHPVHYPRLTAQPDPAGKNFEWFGSNENGRKATNGQPRRNAKKLSLPSAIDDPGLPLDPTT